ncbi:MAG TPA: HAD family phosphatase [Bacteroidales bacterium]|nr:HAD family phosphatase [Bacteroidales bacterium]
MTKQRNIKQIVFDFGGVVVDLNIPLTYEAFAKLHSSNGLAEPDLERFTEIQHEYEKGSLNDATFRLESLKALNISNVDDHQFDTAWNAMIGKVPTERVALIDKLRNRYRVFLLSNTNEIHYRFFISDFRSDYNGRELDSLFDKAWYSFLLGMRKPNRDIFDAVAKASNFDPATTLFIDDTPMHVEGARKAGWNAVHLNNPTTICDLFDSQLNLRITL